MFGSPTNSIIVPKKLFVETINKIMAVTANKITGIKAVRRLIPIVGLSLSGIGSICKILFEGFGLYLLSVFAKSGPAREIVGIAMIIP
jgi:hypothetical protein